jgi:hypothetical protein
VKSAPPEAGAIAPSEKRSADVARRVPSEAMVSEADGERWALAIGGIRHASEEHSWRQNN